VGVYDRKSKPQGSGQWEWITKAQAQKMLANPATHQRDIVKTHVVFLTRMMETMRWEESMQDAVVIDTDGKLSNANHRLHGFLNSDLPGMWFWVVRDARPESYSVYDNGRVRRVRDVLEGPNSGTMSPLVTWSWQLVHGLPWQSASSKIGNAEAAEHLLKYEDALRTAHALAYQSAGRAVALGTVGNTTVALFCFHLLNTESATGEQIADYLDYVGDWEGARDGHLPLRLRNRLKECGISQKTRTHAINTLIAGWNLWVSGKVGAQIRGLVVAPPKKFNSAERFYHDIHEVKPYSSKKK
jgi:hypothetical protein